MKRAATISLILGLVLAQAAPAATPAETQSFLRAYRHAWLPYPWPGETTTNELAKLLQYDFDTIGLSFAGSYHRGQIDFSTIDAAVSMAAGRGKNVVLSLTPRFDAGDGVFDRMSDGSFITNAAHQSPNYAMIDIFNPSQRAKFNRWIQLCVNRYGEDPRVAGFVLGWGYMGETGFYIGDYLSDFKRLGSVASGYSNFALREFNAWRRGQFLPALERLPVPSLTGADRDYILFQRFRSEFAGGLFQKEAVAAAQALTRKPVGIFGYISVNGNNYGRGWAATPNADFYRSAVSAASFDLTRTLLDSGVGWEDHELNDGPWNYTVACLERDLARQIVHGAVVHAMPIRDYEKRPPWETNFFPRLAAFLLTQKLESRVRPASADVALYQPTWGWAALPGKSAANPFIPRADEQACCRKMIGLAESFGLSYHLITERDLLAPGGLQKYQHVIIPLWDLMPDILGARAYAPWARDPRVMPIPSGTWAPTRSEFRRLLRAHQVPTKFDFDSDRILAGRVNNLIFNWNDQPLAVKPDGSGPPITLQPMEFRFLP